MISLFLVFPEKIFTGTWFWRGLENPCFQPLSQDFFAGIPVKREFLYLYMIPPASRFFRIPVPAKSCLT